MSAVIDHVPHPVGEFTRAAARMATSATVFDFASELSATLHAQVLDEVDIGLMLTSASGHLLHANRAALQACARGRPCRLVDGRVHACRPEEAGAFVEAFKRASEGRRSLLAFDADGLSRAVAFVPVASDDAPAIAATVLLVFGRQEICGPLSVQLFARQYGVTNAESAVLRGLCNGYSPREIAQENGTAVSTVRAQIKKVRERTGTRSVAELLRVAAMLPPLRVVAS